MKNITLFFTIVLLSTICLSAFFSCSNSDKDQMVELLKSDTTEWNEYVAEQRSSNPSWRAELKNSDLSGLDLSGVDFERANLEGVNFEGANLTNANLSHAEMKHANIGGANLTNANLEGTVYAHLAF